MVFSLYVRPEIKSVEQLKGKKMASPGSARRRIYGSLRAQNTTSIPIKI